MTKVTVENLPHSPSPDGLSSQQAKTLTMQLTENIKSLKRQLEVCQSAVQELQRAHPSSKPFDTSGVDALVAAAEEAAASASAAADAASASAASAEGSAGAAEQSAASASAAKESAETAGTDAAESANSAAQSASSAIDAKDAAEAAAESVRTGGSNVSFVIANMANNANVSYSLSSLVPSGDPANAVYTVDVAVHSIAAVAVNNFSFENIGHALSAYSVNMFSANNKRKTENFLIKVNSTAITVFVTIRREEA